MRKLLKSETYSNPAFRQNNSFSGFLSSPHWGLNDWGHWEFESRKGVVLTDTGLIKELRFVCLLLGGGEEGAHPAVLMDRSWQAWHGMLRIDWVDFMPGMCPIFCTTDILQP